MVIYNERVVVPPSLRKEVLETLHSAHQGIRMMTQRAMTSVFWPGITNQIKEMRERCECCDRIAPSMPSAPPTPIVDSVYPFQNVCNDYFHHQGVVYVIYVDRYSDWPVVRKAEGGSAGLIKILRSNFATVGVPEEIATDGGPEYTSHALESFLKNWGVRHRLSSTYFPHSNCRAEVCVKTVKRMIMDNTGKCGELNTDKFQRAMLQYRNTRDPETKMSPAIALFNRDIRDFIPILPGRYVPHDTWRETAKMREDAMRNRHMREVDKLSQGTKNLPSLEIADKVRVQNQHGPNPLKWDKTGIVVEKKDYDQYIVKMDGSGRVTLRNRKFLRKYKPYYRREDQLAHQYLFENKSGGCCDSDQY